MAASAAALAHPSAGTAKTESNRLNALLSTGPRTPEGKAVSSRNAAKHGLFTSISALPAHEREILDRFLAEFGPRPDDRPELEDVVTRWALLRYRIDKCQRLEFACQHQLAVQYCEANEIEFPADPLEIARVEAAAFIGDQKGAKVLTRLQSYEARLQRDLNRTLAEFNDLVALLEQQSNPPEPGLASFCQPKPLLRLADPELARSAPCPCGSGLKYKRCCGKNAPPRLNLK